MWKDHVDSVVKKCNQCEFQSNAAAVEELMKTGDKVTAEATRDTHWGTAVNLAGEAVLDQISWHGGNVMGQILMKIRNEMYGNYGQDQVENDHESRSRKRYGAGGSPGWRWGTMGRHHWGPQL